MNLLTLIVAIGLSGFLQSSAEDLVTRLRSDDPEVRAKAVGTIADLGIADLNAFSKTLEGSDDPEARLLGTEAISKALSRHIGRKRQRVSFFLVASPSVSKAWVKLGSNEDSLPVGYVILHDVPLKQGFANPDEDFLTRQRILVHGDSFLSEEDVKKASVQSADGGNSAVDISFTNGRVNRLNEVLKREFRSGPPPILALSLDGTVLSLFRVQSTPVPNEITIFGLGTRQEIDRFVSIMNSRWYDVSLLVKAKGNADKDARMEKIVGELRKLGEFGISPPNELARRTLSGTMGIAFNDTKENKVFKIWRVLLQNDFEVLGPAERPTDKPNR
jgi:hypothetical protein